MITNDSGPQRPPGRALSLNRIQAGWLTALFLCLCAQSVIKPDDQNQLSALLALATGLIVTPFFDKARVARYPVSSVMILGFAFSVGAGGLIGQTGYLQPIDTNLEHPIATFAIGFGFTLVLAGAHLLYRHAGVFQAARGFVSTRVYRPAGIFRIPTGIELLIAGGIGIVAIWLAGSSFEQTGAVVNADAGGKLWQALRPLIGLPLLIFVAPLFGGRRPRSVLPALAFGGVLLATALAANTRATFSFALFSLLLAALILVLVGTWRVTRHNAHRIWIAIAVAAVMIPVLGRVSTAIVLARDARGTVSQFDLVGRTLATALDSEAIARYRRDNGIQTLDYNEIYTPNADLNRMLSIKYTDLIYSSTRGMGESQTRLARQQSIDTIAGALPQPVLDAIGSRVDKRERAFSTGDFYNVGAGRYGTLGSFLSGSSLVDALVLFGWAGPFVIAGLALVLFVLVDAFARCGVDRTAIVSPLGLLLLARLSILTLTGDSVAGIVVLIMRDFPQTVLVYALVMGAIRYLGRSSAIRSVVRHARLRGGRQGAAETGPVA